MEKLLMEKKSGVVFIDKPYGINSHYTSELVKRLVNAEKAGHTGTLDPKVTGLLIVLINKATRLAEIFNLDKTYIGIGKLHREVSLKELKKAKERFVGKIMQLPPRRSSVKREEREREIYDFKILEKQGKYFLFRVRCQAGTYIRKLIYDLGNLIGGANMLELRRIAIGRFKEASAISLYDLEKQKENAIIPIEKIIRHLSYKKVNIAKKLARIFCNGNFLDIKKLQKREQAKIKKTENNFLIMICNKRVIGIGIKKDNEIRPRIVLTKV